MNLKINIFTKKRSSLIEKSLRFHIVFGFDRKIYQVFWRENTTEKKVCAFVMCLVLIEKIYRVFWREKHCTAQLVFSH